MGSNLGRVHDDGPNPFWALWLRMGRVRQKSPIFIFISAQTTITLPFLNTRRTVEFCLFLLLRKFSHSATNALTGTPTRGFEFQCCCWVLILSYYSNGMGKLGKKARKFAKKNLQTVLKRKRKLKSMFKKKAPSSKISWTKLKHTHVLILISQLRFIIPYVIPALFTRFCLEVWTTWQICFQLFFMLFISFFFKFRRTGRRRCWKSKGRRVEAA